MNPTEFPTYVASPKLEEPLFIHVFDVSEPTSDSTAPVHRGLTFTPTQYLAAGPDIDSTGPTLENHTCFANGIFPAEPVWVPTGFFDEVNTRHCLLFGHQVVGASQRDSNGTCILITTEACTAFQRYDDEWYDQGITFGNPNRYAYWKAGTSGLEHMGDASTLLGPYELNELLKCNLSISENMLWFRVWSWIKKRATRHGSTTSSNHTAQ